MDSLVTELKHRSGLRRESLQTPGRGTRYVDLLPWIVPSLNTAVAHPPTPQQLEDNIVTKD